MARVPILDSLFLLSVLSTGDQVSDKVHPTSQLLSPWGREEDRHRALKVEKTRGEKEKPSWRQFTGSNGVAYSHHD